MVKRSTNNISVAEMHSLHRLNRFVYNRELDWSNEKQDLFIDSIQNQYSIGVVILIQDIDPSGHTSYRVVDGVQRLKSIFSYLDSESEVDLPLWQYRMIVEYIETEDEDEIRKIRGRVS